MFRLLHHIAELFLTEKRRDLTLKFSCRLLPLLSPAQKINQLTKIPYSLVIIGFRLIQPHVDDQDDLLAHMVKSNDLVKEHEVHVAEVFCVLRLSSRTWFAVAEIVKGKIAYKTACEGRQVIKMRAPVG